MSTNPTPSTPAKAHGKMPEPYDGTTEKYRGFQTQMKVYLQLNKDVYLDDEEKILFCLSMVQGGGWVQQYAENTMERFIDKGFPTLDNLWKQLDRFFINRNKEDQAASQLEKLQQKEKTASEFFIQFTLLAIKAGMNVEDVNHYPYLRQLMNRNLNSPLVDNLHCRENMPMTFKAYREAVENLNTVWRQRTEDRKGRDPPQWSNETKKGNDAPRSLEDARML